MPKIKLTREEAVDEIVKVIFEFHDIIFRDIAKAIVRWMDDQDIEFKEVDIEL